MPQIIGEQTIIPLIEEPIIIPTPNEQTSSNELYWELGIVIVLVIVMGILATSFVAKTNWFSNAA